MGDYARSHDYTGDEVVKCVINEGDWSNHRGDAEVDYEGECNYEDEDGARIEGEGNDEDSGLNVEFSYTYDSSQQVGGAAAVYSYDSGQPVASEHPRHRRRHSTSAVPKLVKEPGSLQSSSEEDEVKVKSKTKKKSHFHHLAEPPQDDTYSDPGCGESHSGYCEVGRSQSINAVTSWLHDAHLGEHSESIAPRRRAPGRRHPPPATHASQHYSGPGDDETEHYRAAAHSSHYYEGPRDNEAPYYDMSTYDSSGYQRGHFGNSEQQDGHNRDQAFDVYGSSVNGGIYRPEARPLEKCLNFLKIGARAAASVSMAAATNVGAVSRTAAIAVGKKTIEVKNHMAPVFAPIIDAVVEESKFHLMGPDPITATSRGRSAPISDGRGRGIGRGRGRAAPLGPSPMHPGPGRAGMRPTMRSPGMGPGRPELRPPGMVPRRPEMRPPSMGPRRPEMSPPDMVPGRPGVAMAPRPNTMAPPIARGQGQGMAIRRPVGAARGRARPVLAAASTDY